MPETVESPTSIIEREEGRLSESKQPTERQLKDAVNALDGPPSNQGVEPFSIPAPEPDVIPMPEPEPIDEPHPEEIPDLTPTPETPPMPDTPPNKMRD